MSPPTDSQGRCPHHPFVQLQRLSSRTNEWKALLDSCPICTLDNKSTCSSAASSVCSALNNINGEEDEKVVGSVGDGLVSDDELIVKQSSQRGRRSESQSTHRSRGRSQPRTQSSSSSSLDEIKPRRSRSNSRVRFCPPTTQGDGSNLSTSLALINNNNSNNVRSGGSGFVRQSSSSSMPALGNGTASALLCSGGTTVPGLDTSSTCGSISSTLSSSAISTSIISSSAISTASSSQPIQSLLNKDPKYKVCPTTMQRQLDESIKVTTMSMDISIDEDSWKSKSSSTLNLTYGGDDQSHEGRNEEDHGDDVEGERAVQSHDERQHQSEDEQQEEDTRRLPNRQRFKDEEDEDASDCEEEEENEEQPSEEYQVEEDQKEDEGIMLCMPVANAQKLEPHQDEPTSRQEHQEEQEDDEIEIGVRRLRESVERHSRRRYRSREPTSRSSRSSSLAPQRGHTGDDDDENDSQRRRGHSTSSSSSRRQRSSSCQIIGSRYSQATTQLVQRPDPEEFPCQDYSSQASTQDRRNGGTMLLVKQPSWPPPQDSDLKSLEPEEEKQDHTQHHQRRQRRSRSARHTARSSSFTYGGNERNGHHQVPPPPPPPPPPLKNTSPPQRQNSAPPASFSSAIVVSQSSPTHKPKVGHNHVNMIVNPRQDDDTISTLSFMGNKASSIIPQRQFLRDPQGGGQQLQDVNELPLPMKTSDGTVISSHSICEEDMKQPSSVNVNTNNYDKRGRCVVHPHIRLRKKKLLNRLCLGSSNKDNPDGGGWKILMSACPDCCVDELRRIRLVEENNKRLALVATQQQHMCQSVATNEMSLVPLDTSERSHQSVTDHHQQAATNPGRGVATLDMLLDGNNSQQQQHRGSMTRGRRNSTRSLHSVGSNDTPSSNHQGSMMRSSSVSARAMGGQRPSPPKRSPSQDSFRQRRSSSLRSPSQTPPKRSPSQDSFRAPRSSSCVPVSKHIGKSIKKKLNRRPSEETASLTGSSSGSSNEKQNPAVASSSKSSPLDTSDRTGTTHDSTLASTSSPLSQQQFVEHSPADRRSSYGSSHQGSHEVGEDGVTPIKKKRRSKRDKSRSSKRSSSSVSSSQQDSVSSKSVSSSNPPTPGQRGTINVRQMQWTNPKNNQSGTYTGQVNHLFIPHGHGVMTYADQTLGVKDGEWKNGRYRRSNHDGSDGSSRRGSTSSRKSGSSRASKSSSHTHKSKKSDRKERRSRSRSRSHRHHAVAHQQSQVETQ